MTKLSMRYSETIDKLGTAMAALAKELENPARSKTVEVTARKGGKFSFSYAPLDTILEKVRPLMAKHGLSVIQMPAETDNGAVLATMLLHSSGQWLQSDMPMETEGLDAQKVGSLITYYRRYCLCAMLGITAEEDDDANAYDGNTVRPSRRSDRVSDRHNGPDDGPDPDAWAEKARALRNKIEKAYDIRELDELWARSEPLIDDIERRSKATAKALIDAFKNRELEMKGGENG